MGAVTFRGSEFVGSLGETTGYKSGLALSEDELRSILMAGGYDGWWPRDPDSWLRIRSEELEEIFAWTLGRLGVAPREWVASPVLSVHKRIRDNPRALEVFELVGKEFTDFLRHAVDTSQPGTAIDPVPFFEESFRKYGATGLDIARMLIDALVTHQLQSPYSTMRRVEWVDLRQLEDLFRSENLPGPHGDYFDERFANFLAVNFERIDQIHWRQFEGLAAEFFREAGYAVELGPGRNDNGVDIRLRPESDGGEGPAVVLVQCKRQRNKIDKATVKALYADVEAERAAAGVIVTTSTFSPGARTIRTARGYPIVEMDRPHVRHFVEQLRTPGTGMFLAG